MKLSIAFQSNKSLDQYTDLARLVERYDFDTLTLYEDLMFQPAWQPLQVIAQNTSRIRLGPAVVNPYLRHPAVIAGEFALLNDASGGRAYLGVGRGAFLGALNMEQPRPISAVRETIELVRRFLHGDRTPYDGTVFRATEDAYFRWRPTHTDVPVLVGTWGPKMAALAGELADEVKVGGCWNPAFVPVMQRYIGRGARAAGRDPDEIGIVVGAVTVVSHNPHEAEALARREVAMYLPVVGQLDPTLDPEERAALADVEAAYKRDGVAAAATRIPGRTLRKFACFGTPADIVEQVAALQDAGASRVEFGTPHGQDEMAAIELLGEQVLPEFTQQ